MSRMRCKAKFAGARRISAEPLDPSIGL